MTNVGERIDLATHHLTKHFGIGGVGEVTVVKSLDKTMNKHLVIVKTPKGRFLHVTTKNIKPPTTGDDK